MDNIAAETSTAPFDLPEAVAPAPSSPTLSTPATGTVRDGYELTNGKWNKQNLDTSTVRYFMNGRYLIGGK
jgi:hypothetical protein